MNRLRFTHRFERNLGGILAFISQDEPVAAKRVIRDIRASIQIPETFANVGRPGTVTGTRELV